MDKTEFDAEAAQLDLYLACDRQVWVSNSSSTAVTCGIARRWPSGMIVGRGGTTALSHLPAARGMPWAAGP
jgi:hypothetical protein